MAKTCQKHGDEKKAQLHAHLPVQLKRQLDDYAMIIGHSQSWVITDALEHYFLKFNVVTEVLWKGELS